MARNMISKIPFFYLTTGTVTKNQNVGRNLRVAFLSKFANFLRNINK